MNDQPAPEGAHIPTPFRVSQRVRYATSVGCACIASVLVALCPLLHISCSVKGIFVAAVFASTWFGGTAPGLVAIAVLLLLNSRLLLPPAPTVESWLHLAVFVLINGLLSWFVGLRRRSFARLVVELLQYRLIFSWLPIGIVLFDLDRTVRFFNPAFERLYGWSLDELRGKPLPIPESELTKWDELQDKLRKGGSFRNILAKRVRKDGSEFNALLSGIPVKDDYGIVSTLVGLAIEADPKPEVLLERKRLEFLLNNSSDFICITDLDQRIQFINSTGKDMVGIGEGQAEQLTPLLSLFQEEDHATITGTMLTMALDGAPMMRPLNLKNLTTGDLVPVQGTIRGITDPGTGSIGFLAYILQNRSDLNRAEARRIRAENAFKTLFRNAPVAMALVNTNGVPFDSNERFQQLLGYSAEEVKQGPFARFVHPEDLPRGREIFLELASGKTESYQVNKRLCDKNGNQLWAKMTVSLVRGDGGEPSYCISMVEPIAPSSVSAGLSQQPIRLVG
jgi:PAS domain S-box-containing protein